MLIGVVALIVVGPQRLPGMMANVGKWSNKMRRMLFDVRQQSGIDDILRAEGITGGLNEIRALRNAVRGNVQSLAQSFTRPPTPASASPTSNASAASPTASPAAGVSPAVASTPLGVESDPYANVPYDRTREYPDEGCDAYGAIPDDLWAATHRPVAPAEPLPEPPANQVDVTLANAAPSEVASHGDVANPSTADGAEASSNESATAAEAAEAQPAEVQPAAVTNVAPEDAPATPQPQVDGSTVHVAESASEAASPSPPPESPSHPPEDTTKAPVSPSSSDVAPSVS